MAFKKWVDRPKNEDGAKARRKKQMERAEEKKLKKRNKVVE